MPALKELTHGEIHARSRQQLSRVLRGPAEPLEQTLHLSGIGCLGTEQPFSGVFGDQQFFVEAMDTGLHEGFLFAP